KAASDWSSAYRRSSSASSIMLIHLLTPAEMESARKFCKSRKTYVICPPNFMKLGIINSAFQQVGIDTATGLQHIERIGFDCVDIFTEAMGISKKEVGIVARTTEKLGLPIISLPVVAVGLIDFNDSVREFHIERCKRFIDLAREWSAKNILLVLGEYIW